MNIDSETEAEDNVTIRVFDAEAAPTMEAARDATPKKEVTLHNTTRDAYHEQVIEGLAGNVSIDVRIDAFALGDSTTGTANLGRTQPLGNELFRSSTVDLDANGQTLSAQSFVDASEANTLTLKEFALVAERPSGNLPINRFILNDPGNLLAPKSRNETVTISVQITQTDA
jgi:hypothetical protein